MGVVTILSIAGMVAAFFIKPLSGFAVPDVVSSVPGVNDPIDESYSSEAVHQAADLFSNAYMSIIDDLVSFQKTPDYRRTESRRQEMTNVGTSLIGMFQDFGGRLQGEFGALVPQTGDTDALALQ